ncbi:hypothetical protein [Rhodovarius sp.]|uniref:hypothetical protein n=1 Tax=Rhodovarius sp. TaxID=2972673 RepID=UPI00333F78A6
MQAVDDLKIELRRVWSEQPATHLCVKLIDFLSTMPSSQSQMFTFANLSRAVGKAKPDEDLLTAITILVSSKIEALDAHAMFVDENQVEHEISAEELKEAKETGSLIHPVTGYALSDFEKHIIPFFSPSSKFRRLIDPSYG